jgi:hypothetical protein
MFFLVTQVQLLIVISQWNRQVSDHRSALISLNFFLFYSYVDQETAFSTGLAYVTDNNEVIMKGDDTTWLAAGVYRNRSSGLLRFVADDSSLLFNIVFGYPARPCIIPAFLCLI